MESSKKIAYVILHFQAYEMTIQCVNSLLDVIDDMAEIVIVDNASPNGSGSLLKEKYQGINNVSVLVLNENVGFACGNNSGYEFARNNLRANAIVVMNNDIVVEQKDFHKKLLGEIKKNADILAPDIMNKAGNHQNPYRTKQIDKKEVLWVLVYNFIMFGVMYIPFVNVLYIKLIKVTRRKRKKIDTRNCNDQVYNIVPHGAMIILNERFCNNEKRVFNPNTFLFCEEDLLYLYCKKMGYSIMYTNKLKIIHLEDVATDSFTKNDVNKRKFVAKHKIHSCWILLKELL